VPLRVKHAINGYLQPAVSCIVYFVLHALDYLTPHAAVFIVLSSGWPTLPWVHSHRYIVLVAAALAVVVVIVVVVGGRQGKFPVTEFEVYDFQTFRWHSSSSSSSSSSS